MRVSALIGALALAGHAAASTGDEDAIRAELAETKAMLVAMKLEIQEDKKRALLSASAGSMKTAHEYLVEATAAFTEDRRQLSADSGAWPFIWFFINRGRARRIF